MLKLSALTPGGLRIEESKFVKVSERTAQRFHLRKGDLLICRSNAYEYVAKTALVNLDYPTILFPDIIIRVRVGKDLLVEYAREGSLSLHWVARISNSTLDAQWAACGRLVRKTYGTFLFLFHLWKSSARS